MAGTPSAADPPRRATPAWVAIVRDAGGISVLATVLALGVNTLRSDGLPWIAREEIEIMVPCPEPMGEATGIPAADPRTRADTSLLVDARSSEEYAAWHPPGAVSFPFDWLAEQDEVAQQAAVVAREIARSRRRDVVVYGDGEDPDSGEHWAALLSGAGIKNVVFVQGGAPALGQPGAEPAPSAPFAGEASSGEAGAPATAGAAPSPAGEEGEP